MKISLRAANALQITIGDIIKEIDVSGTIKLNQFQEPFEAIDAKTTVALNNITRWKNLQSVLAEIRKSVSKANYHAGISDMLANLAFIEKEIQLLSTLSKYQPKLDAPVITGKLEKIKATVEDSYYRSEQTVDTSVYSVDDISRFRAELLSKKKTKANVQNILLEANIKNEIELSEFAQAVLTAEEIL